MTFLVEPNTNVLTSGPQCSPDSPDCGPQLCDCFGMDTP